VNQIDLQSWRGVFDLGRLDTALDDLFELRRPVPDDSNVGLYLIIDVNINNCSDSRDLIHF
jgi:hypothetical protein